MFESKEEKKEKCFVIMPISDQGDYTMGHFTKVYEQIIKPSIEEAGYEAYRVDENNICDSIINKIFDAIQECPMAVCDLSNRNPNVLYELGLRQAYDKPVVLFVYKRQPYKKAGSRPAYRACVPYTRVHGLSLCHQVYKLMYALVAYYVYTAEHRGTSINHYHIQAVQYLAGQAAGNNRQLGGHKWQQHSPCPG